MAVTQTLLTPTVIAKEALMQLENFLVMGNLIHRKYKDEFRKIGDTVTIRKPVKFVANDGYDITSQIQKVYEESTTLQVSTRKNVAWEFNSNELTMTIDKYSERYIQPAMIVLADKIDVDCMALYKDVWNSVGVPETTPSSFSNIADAAQKLTESSCPYGSRSLVLNPAGYWNMADAFKDMQVQDVASAALKQGRVLPLAGFNIYESQNIPVHTTGTATSATVVNGTDNKSATLTAIESKTGSGTMKKGDVFTVEDVYGVNTVNKASLSSLRQFVATADVANVGSGTIGVAKMVMSDDEASGPAYQNISAYVVDGKDITMVTKTEGSVSTHPVNLAFHKNAFALVTFPLALPDGVAFKARQEHRGISIRVLKAFDIKLDVDIIRLDILYGTKTLYAELACRVCG